MNDVEVFRNAAIEAAKIAGESAEMDKAAQAVADAIKADATGSRKTGAYIDSIGVTSDVYEPAGIKDRVVYTTDPQAHIIEYGYTHKHSGKRVPGKFHFTNRARKGL